MAERGSETERMRTHRSASPRNSSRSLSTKSSWYANLLRESPAFLLLWMKAAWKTCGLRDGRAGAGKSPSGICLYRSSVVVERAYQRAVSHAISNRISSAVKGEGTNCQRAWLLLLGLARTRVARGRDELNVCVPPSCCTAELLAACLEGAEPTSVWRATVAHRWRQVAKARESA